MPIIDTGRTFEIYSIGDGLFMRRIIDSISAMNNAGVLLDLVALSMMLGLLIMAFRNVAAGGSKLDLGSTLVSLILGVSMFGMKATVVIHDMNYAPGEVDQPSYVVDNVPFGVAAAGYIISGIGYELTLKMEQGYGLYSGSRSSMIEGGFGNTLSWINQLRAWENPMFTDGGSGDAARFRENMTEYMKSCVLPGVEMGHLSLPQILSTTNIWSEGTPTSGGIGYPSVWLSTKYRSSGGSPQSVTCEYAWEHLDAEHDVVFDAYANALAKSQLGQSTSGQDVETALSEAYDSIGVSTSQMQELVVAGAVGVSLELALKGRDSASLEANSKLMIEQAAMQRSVQWAAEETMFRRIMRPMMAFFESLMYALAPFMALAIGLGSYGIQTVGKYLMLSIWVALWMPVLSIIELYQVTMMQHAVNAMMHGLDGYQTINGISIAGSNELRGQAIEWLSTGAAMAAFTPAITMALVWGGAITASSLANQIRGADTVNEKISAPDTVNPGAATSVGPRAENTAALGTQQGGSSGLNPRISVGSDSSEMMTSSIREVASAKEARQAAYNEVVRQTFGTSSGVQATSGTRDEGSTSNADFGSARQGVQRSTGKDDTVDHASSTATSNSVDQSIGWNGAVAVGGGSLPGGGVKAGGNNVEQMRSDVVDRAGQSSKAGQSRSAEVGSGSEFRNGRTQSEGRSLTETEQATLQKALDKSESYQKALAAERSAEKSFQQVAQMQSRWGSQQSVDVAALAHDMAKNNPQMAGNVGSLVSQAGLADQVKSNEARFRSLSGAERTLAAQILTLHEGAMQGTARGADAGTANFRREAFAQVMNGSAMPAPVETGALRPDTHRGVSGNLPTQEKLEELTAGATGSGVNAGALRSQVEAITSGQPGAVAGLVANTGNAVGATPSNYGSKNPSEGMTPAEASENAGTPMLKNVEHAANQNLADAANGYGSRATHAVATFTNMDGAGVLAGAVASAHKMPEGHAGIDHPVTKQAEAYQHRAPFLNQDQAHMLAVKDQIENGNNTSVPKEDLMRAVRYMQTPEGSATMSSYGDKFAGQQRLDEDRIKANNGERTRVEILTQDFSAHDRK